MTSKLAGEVYDISSQPLSRLSVRADPWRIGTFAIALVALLPVLAILWLAVFPTENIWPHLISTSLPRYLKNTALLMLGVGASVFLTGVSTAYLISNFEFPLRRYFEWLLLLPLAFPAYVIAYLYTDLLEFAGPIQHGLRVMFDWQLATDYWFPDVRSMGGAIMLMGLVLYPYVYLMARASFIEQSSYLSDASRLMGRNMFKTFLFVSLPIARPAIAIGVALALMETLNDFGTVDFFAIHTLTAGLYDVWFNMGNLGGAAQIASVMLTFVVLLLGLEFAGRRRRRFYQSATRFIRTQRIPLTGKSKWLAFLMCAAPVVFGFLLPLGMLFDYAFRYFDESWNPAFRTYAFNSLFVSITAALVCITLAVLVCYTRRLYKDTATGVAARIATLGYAMPGAVLAVGVVIPLASFDNMVDGFFRQYFGFSSGLLLTGTTFALIMTYTIRFLAISIGSVESSMSKISESMDMAARTLGHPAFRTLRLFHLPLLRGGIMTAALIVFVDCMKELPATLLLRPFNFDTLATHVYQFASDEMIEQSALGSLVIVLSGLLPVVLLSSTISRTQHLDRIE
jgi:iron(III) transport system permease protein